MGERAAIQTEQQSVKNTQRVIRHQASVISAGFICENNVVYVSECLFTIISVSLQTWASIQSKNYTNLENALVGPYAETYPTPRDANQSMNVKAEAVSDAEAEEDPVPITFSEMKAEPEVSCMCAVRQMTQICRNAACLSDIHLCVHDTTLLRS
ncbi:uncharacterized protein LOC111874578 isoform X1 [Cryptotermes secundus]|uniref:uncharacterized protein LOC111874578 isoform X1 n=1 Tax=Cryptotermes secundus TaxID=105785 RepID=UPI000CD7B7AF|nr:uncharacterized protein LOC111874578 isoform X1 [Cryptotermes secundus]XP_023725958.1 uncharacterized protein LOC111874578 isoform X1 [Cryptotermes secundus]